MHAVLTAKTRSSACNSKTNPTQCWSDIKAETNAQIPNAKCCAGNKLTFLSDPVLVRLELHTETHSRTRLCPMEVRPVNLPCFSPFCRFYLQILKQVRPFEGNTLSGLSCQCMLRLMRSSILEILCCDRQVPRSQWRNVGWGSGGAQYHE